VKEQNEFESMGKAVASAMIGMVKGTWKVWVPMLMINLVAAAGIIWLIIWIVGRLAG
jgi:hypothetical protein